MGLDHLLHTLTAVDIHERNKTMWKTEYILYSFVVTFQLHFHLLTAKGIRLYCSSPSRFSNNHKCKKTLFKWRKLCLERKENYSMNDVNCRRVHPQQGVFLTTKGSCFSPTFQHTSGSSSETHLFLIKANSVPTFALNMRTKEHKKRTLFLQSFEAAASWYVAPGRATPHGQWIHSKTSNWQKISGQHFSQLDFTWLIILFFIF